MLFHDSSTSRTYSDRLPDATWQAWCTALLQPAGKDVVDLGCGGGIYARGFAGLGARTVVGVDQSQQYIEEASAAQSATLRFQVGSVTATGLPEASADLVFERAVIHHLDAATQAANACEVRRILRAGGVFAVQDRTFEDVLAADPAFWIRATLFECFPRLLDYERARRPARQAFVTTLQQAGFPAVRCVEYREIRKQYADFAQLQGEIMARKGKSILFELNDAELAQYCAALESKAQHLPLTESDPWTVWLAQ